MLTVEFFILGLPDTKANNANNGDDKQDYFEYVHESVVI